MWQTRMQRRWWRAVWWTLVVSASVLCVRLFYTQPSTPHGKRATTGSAGTTAGTVERLQASVGRTTTLSPSPSPPRVPTSLDTFRARSLRVQEACQAARATQTQQNQTRAPLPVHVLHVRSISFCSLPKTGTTFWKRILYNLDKGLSGPLLSHDYGDIHGKTNYMDNPDRRRLQTYNPATVVFVREPYRRLFSAYVNKLFLPRVANWDKYARPALRYSRVHATPLQLRCSHDVTFAEFVRYFIHSERDDDPNVKRDEHLVPISQQCGFCRQSHSFIGRQETFAEDTLGILAHLNLSSLLAWPDFYQRYELYEMDALIRYTFEHELKPVTAERGCMKKEEVLRRLWKHFQISGALGAEEFFPLAKPDVDKVTKEEFLRVAELTYNRSAGDGDRHSSPIRSMLEAYSTVPRQDRLLLRHIFHLDFEFFGYPPDHQAVFPAGDQFVLPYYRYLDVFDTFLFTDRGA